MVKITFNNGEYIEAEQNGNCYVTDKKPQFPNDLSNITIEDEAHFDHAQLVECASIDGRYWFTFIEKSLNEVRISELEDAIIELAGLVG